MNPLNTKVVAPSSALGDGERLQAGVELLRSWGLHIESVPDPARHWGYFAGSDQQRLDDFNGSAELWACARGGWGAARLLEQGWQGVRTARPGQSPAGGLIQHACPMSTIHPREGAC